MTEKSNELYRDATNGRIAGVCAGLANYLGWEVWLVRILVVSGVLLGMFWLTAMYLAAWFILDKKPSQPIKHHKSFSNSASRSHTYDVVNESIKVKTRIWQSGEPPQQAFRDIGMKFQLLEKKLRVMEKYVTSSEFTVAREINRL